jgi:hypothetical protein
METDVPPTYSANTAARRVKKFPFMSPLKKEISKPSNSISPTARM